MKVTARYDPAYERWRDSLIPQAAARADAMYPEPIGAGVDAHRAWRNRWDAAFLRYMDQLAGDPMSDASVN